MDSKNLKFSVAISVYKNDNPNYLREALESICTQSYLPAEVFLVIDGPIGNDLYHVIDEYSRQYSFFTIKQLQKNCGLGNALRLAVEECKYDIILRMDSDDICAPDRFKKQIDAYSEEPADVLGGFILGFVDDLSFGNVFDGPRKLSNEEILQEMKHVSPMSHVTVLLNRNAVLKAGNYQELFYHEDYYLWVRMAEAGCKFRNIPEYLVYVRFGKDQAKRHGGKRYYDAEKKLRKYMLQKHIINSAEYRKEMALRYVYQLVLPPIIRNFIATRLTRKTLNRKQYEAVLGNGECSNHV